VTNRGRAGRGRAARADTHPLDLLAACSNRLGGGRAWQGGQGSCYGGPRMVPFLLKKSLGKTEGPASNQTKIQFKKIYIFIIKHIKKTRIFLKKKIETK